MPPVGRRLQIWNAGNEAEGCGCGLFQNRCSEMVMEAGSVWGWIDLFTYSDNCASDCSDAPTGDQCSANVAYETDLYGGDIRDVPVADWTECCDVCREDSDCRAWCGAGRQGGEGAHMAVSPACPAGQVQVLTRTCAWLPLLQDLHQWRLLAEGRHRLVPGGAGGPHLWLVVSAGIACAHLVVALATHRRWLSPATRSSAPNCSQDCANPCSMIILSTLTTALVAIAPVAFHSAHSIA